MPAPLHMHAQTGVHQAVVPAAGLGTRLRPLTNAIPKELLPIGRKPVLEHVLDELAGAGIQRVLFIISSAKQQIRSYFGDAFQCASGALIECSYECQAEQRGVGHAVLHAEVWARGADFVVAFGDCLIEAQNSSAPLRRLIETHVSQSCGATVLVEAVDRSLVTRYGVVAPAPEADSSGRSPFRATNIVEKPSVEDAPSAFAVAARWVFGSAIFEALRTAPIDSRGELTLTDAARSIGCSGSPFWAVPLLAAERREDIGSFDSFFAASIRAACRDTELGYAAREAARCELEAANVGER